MVERPPHAYVPGQTARHPEDWFDAIKASVTDQVPLHLLHETEAFQAGLIYLDEGFYWECHEVLEAVWMRCEDPSQERQMCQALIQIANAQLKRRMGKPRAVERLCRRVETHLARCKRDGPILGLDVETVKGWVGEVCGGK